MFVYCGVTVLYTGVVLSRFQLGSGDTWRPRAAFLLRRHDMGTLIATAMPFRAVLPPWTTTPDRAGYSRRRTRHTGRGADSLRLSRWLHRSARRRPIRVARLHDHFSTARLLEARRDPRRRLRRRERSLLEQIQTIFNPQQDYNLTSNEGRIKVWKRGLAI